MKRHQPPKDRNFDRDEFSDVELMIRVHDRFMDLISEHEELEEHYFTVFDMLSSVMCDEIEDYAFDLAYSLFSHDKISMRNRAERAHLEVSLLQELEKEKPRVYTKKKLKEMEKEKAGKNPGPS